MKRFQLIAMFALGFRCSPALPEDVCFPIEKEAVQKTREQSFLFQRSFRWMERKETLDYLTSLDRVIYNPDPINWGTVPWLVVIAKKNSGEVTCLGTLLTDRKILTAAHCNISMKGSTVFIYNKNNLDKPFEASLALEPCMYHSYKDPGPNDISILTIDREASVNSTEGTRILLPSTAEDHRNQARIVSIVGLIPKVGGDFRKGGCAVGGTTNIGPCNSSANAPSGVLCASPNQRRQGICPGDSGGPAYATIGGGFVELGVAGSSQGCDGGGGDWFTDVQFFDGWIKKAIEIN